MMENLSVLEQFEQLLNEDRKNYEMLIAEVSELIKQSEEEQNYEMCHKLLRFKLAMTRYLRASSN